MFSFDDLNEIAKMFNFDLGQWNNPCKSDGKTDKGSKDGTTVQGKICPGSDISFTPSQLLIIAGFVAKVLEVNSILVAKDQHIEIVLTGSLKRPTQLDGVMQQIGQMPFETVFKSFMDNLGG